MKLTYILIIIALLTIVALYQVDIVMDRRAESGEFSQVDMDKFVPIKQYDEKGRARKNG